LDAYLEALKKFPSSDIRLKTEKGMAFHVKTDVFKEQMWYIQEDKKNPGSSSFIPLTPDRVAEIIEQNKAGKFPTDLKDYMIEVEVELPDYTDVVGQDSLSRFEHVFKRNKKKKKPNKNKQQANKPTNQSNKKVSPDKPVQGNKKPNRRPINKNTPKQKSDNAQKGIVPNPKPNGNKPKPNQPRRKKPVQANQNEGVKENPNQKQKGATVDNNIQKNAPKRKPNKNRRKPNPNKGGAEVQGKKSNTGNGKDSK
jgi:hypothetical protein